MVNPGLQYNGADAEYYELIMPDLVIYDDAAYHEGSPAFTGQHLNYQNSGTHIGMYLAWVIVSRLESFHLRQLAPNAVEEVRSKQMTGRELLFSHCKGKLSSEWLNPEARAFTESYYVEDYLPDYEHTLVSRGKSSYQVEDNWANCDRLISVINRRLSEFRPTYQPPQTKRTQAAP